MLILRRPWDSQPQDATGPNLSGPIRPPSFLYSPIGGAHVDWARGIPSSVSGASVAPSRVGLRFNGGSTYPTFPHIADIRGKSAISIYLHFNCASDPAQDAFTELFNNWDQGFYVVRRYGEIRLYLNGGTVAGGFSSTSGGPLVGADVNWDILVTVEPDGTTAALVNGVEWPMTQFTALTFGSGSSNVVVGSNENNRIAAAAVWPFALTKGERVALMANRWQLFAPRSLIVPVSAAGGGVNASTTLTGAGTTSTAGTLTASGTATKALTGATTTSTAGTVSASAGANATGTITGNQRTASAGTLTATGAAAKTLTGAGTTATAGTVTAAAAGNAATTLTGASTSSTAGTTTASGAATKTLTGVGTTSTAGAVTAAAGGNATTTLTGSATTSAVGALTAAGTATKALAGATTTSAAGALSASVGTNATASLTGAAASATVGALQATGAAQIVVPGAAATAAPGALTAVGQGAAVATLTGAAAIARCGTVVAASVVLREVLRLQSHITTTVAADSLIAAAQSLRSYIDLESIQ